MSIQHNTHIWLCMLWADLKAEYLLVVFEMFKSTVTVLFVCRVLSKTNFDVRSVKKFQSRHRKYFFKSRAEQIMTLDFNSFSCSCDMTLIIST